MGATSSTEIIPVIYKFRLWIYTTILKNHMQTTIDAIIGENQSAPVKNRTILQTFSNIGDVIDLLKLNIYLAWTGTFERLGWDYMPFVSLFRHKFVIRKFILPFVSLLIETILFTRSKLLTPISDIKLKKWSLIWSFYPYRRSFPGGVLSHGVLYYRGWGICHFHWRRYKD